MSGGTVTASRLLALADTISAIRGEAGQQVGNLTSHLDAALANVIDAAKSAAFREALDEHNRRTQPTADEPGKDGGR